jgi:hypothetical protein
MRDDSFNFVGIMVQQFDNVPCSKIREQILDLADKRQFTHVDAIDTVGFNGALFAFIFPLWSLVPRMKSLALGLVGPQRNQQSPASFLLAGSQKALYPTKQGRAAKKVGKKGRLPLAAFLLGLGGIFQGEELVQEQGHGRRIQFHKRHKCNVGIGDDVPSQVQISGAFVRFKESVKVIRAR